MSTDRRTVDRRVSPAIGEYAIQENSTLRAVNAELLAALEMALDYLDHPSVQAIPFAKRAETAAQQIRDVIAKAKGVA